jgi:hypothetical protein
MATHVVHYICKYVCIYYIGKVVPLHVMKAYRSSRGTAPLFRNFGSRWRLRWLVNITPRPLYTRERTPLPAEQEAGRVPAPIWSCGEQKILLPLPGILFCALRRRCGMQCNFPLLLNPKFIICNNVNNYWIVLVWYISLFHLGKQQCTLLSEYTRRGVLWNTCVYYLIRRIWNHEINGILWKINLRYAAWLINAVNFICLNV